MAVLSTRTSPGKNVDITTGIAGTVMVSPKTVGQIITTILHNPKRDTWSVGVVRVTGGLLNPSRSRDSKGTLGTASRDVVHWIKRDEPMPAELRNPLLHLPIATGRCDPE